MTRLLQGRPVSQESGHISLVLAKASKVKPTKKKVHRRKVFVVHGRNHEAREAMDNFLYSIGLLPLYFDEARKLTGRATPFVLDVVKKGLSATQATLVLMTPDDVGCLRQPFRETNEPVHEAQLATRPRQNVIFEAGMAMALRPDKTVLVEIGDPHTIGDLAGLHTVRIDNSIEKREMLVSSLESARCRVDRRGEEWKDKKKAGDFDVAIEASKYNNNERQQLLEDELQRLHGRGGGPLREQPTPVKHRAAARRKARPALSRLEQRREAAMAAMNTLNQHFMSHRLGRLTDVSYSMFSGNGNLLVEGRAQESIHPTRSYGFRILVNLVDLKTQIVSLRRSRI